MIEKVYFGTERNRMDNEFFKKGESMRKKILRRCLTLALAVVLMFGSVLTVSAATTTYTVKYTPDSYAKETTTYTQTYTLGLAIKLKSAVYTRTGYTQSGWLLYNMDDTVSYSLGQVLLAPHYKYLQYVLAFCPSWTANTYYVKYVDPVSGKSTTKTYTYDKSYSYPSASTFTRSGYTLKGWSTISGKSTSTTSYPTGSVSQTGSKLKNLTSTNKKTITLYAVWQKK